MKDPSLTGGRAFPDYKPLCQAVHLKVGCALPSINQTAVATCLTEHQPSVRWTDTEMIQQRTSWRVHGLFPPQPHTLQTVELASAVLSCDVLPVGAAGQGYHGAEGHGSLAHFHLKLQSNKLMWRRLRTALLWAARLLMTEPAQPLPPSISHPAQAAVTSSGVSLHGHTPLG